MSQSSEKSITLLCAQVSFWAFQYAIMFGVSSTNTTCCTLAIKLAVHAIKSASVCFKIDFNECRHSISDQVFS